LGWNPKIEISKNLGSLNIFFARKFSELPSKALQGNFHKTMTSACKHSKLRSYGRGGSEICPDCRELVQAPKGWLSEYDRKLRSACDMVMPSMKEVTPREINTWQIKASYLDQTLEDEDVKKQLESDLRRLSFPGDKAMKRYPGDTWNEKAFQEYVEQLENLLQTHGISIPQRPDGSYS
jgi:hypothetical protein